ncbi:MAG: invasion associated locus B family protein [Magnetococcales bacterium]|nr:invasion associated locus B family protein [Magnetococcales bacterium]
MWNGNVCRSTRNRNNTRRSGNPPSRCIVQLNKRQEYTMSKLFTPFLRAMMLSGLSIAVIGTITFLANDLATASSVAKEVPKKIVPEISKDTKIAQKMWAMVCEEDKEKKKKTCFASQDHSTKEGKLALRFSFGYMEDDKKPFIITMLPLGINLPSGVIVKIDETTPIPLVLQHCTPDGCLGAVHLSATQTDELLKAKDVSVIMLPSGATQPIAFNLNMEGFVKEVKLLP